MVKIIEVSVKELKMNGAVQISERYSDDDILTIYDLEKTSKATQIYETDIVLSDWFSNPLTPTETELTLFELHFGYKLKFIGANNENSKN